jgi:hypothetical protein
MRTLLVATAAAVVSLSACGCSIVTQHATSRRTMIQPAPHVAGSGLEVQTRNGAVDVTGDPARSDAEIEVTFTARAATEAEAKERVDAATLSVARNEHGRLVIKPVFPGGPRDGDGASISVRLPGADGVTIDTSNGPVSVRGLAGALAVDTSNGPVSIDDHDGPARIDTSNGPVKVLHLASSLFVDTSNGPVSAEDVSGPVTVDTSNGPITLSLGPEQGGPLHLDTSNGPITVHVGLGFNGPVRLDTSNGSVTVNDPDHRVTERDLRRSGGSIVVGGGGEPSRLDTSNGPIVFTIRG